MGDEFRWGFEEGYEPDEEPRPRAVSQSAGADGLSGRDPGGVVTVTVDESAEVLSVMLAAEWRRLVDPRVLGSSVLSAANAATMRALARQVEQQSSTAEPSAVPPTASFDDSRITREDAVRLMDAVTADLERFTRQLAEVVDRRFAVESRGGHVTGTAQAGRVIDVAVDPEWASVAPNREIESELLEVVTALHSRSVPQDLAAGPRSPAIAELMALVSDPNTLLRRVGLLP